MMRKQAKQLCALVLSFGILLGVQGGRIALWFDGSDTPAKVFPYPVSALPESERRALQQGIRVESMEQLQQLLEAYLS